MIFRQQLAVLLNFVLLSVIGLTVIGQTSSGIYRFGRAGKNKDKEARKLFKQHCVKCHGADGTGDTPFGEVAGAADFTDSDWQKSVDDQRLINSMTYGRGQMPSFGKKLTKEQITTLLAYVRAFKR